MNRHALTHTNINYMLNSSAEFCFAYLFHHSTSCFSFGWIKEERAKPNFGLYYAQTHIWYLGHFVYEVGPDQLKYAVLWFFMQFLNLHNSLFMHGCLMPWRGLLLFQLLSMLRPVKKAGFRSQNMGYGSYSTQNDLGYFLNG